MACNILWFLSLSFSLGCALLATLVQRWIRLYLQDIQHTSPKQRARMRTFLHHGIDNFQMETLVGMIPTLLHISLCLFYCGVIAFFWSWQKAIAALHIAVLGAFVLAYMALTLLPLLSSSCPFSTPLTIWGWWVIQSIWRCFPSRKHCPPSEKGFAEDRDGAASEPTFERWKRDEEALSWLLDTCTDESELEEFVELIPYVIQDDSSDNSLRSVVYSLLVSPRVQLASPISDLLKSCTTALDVNQRARRVDTCFTAIHSLISFDAARMLSAPRYIRVNVDQKGDNFVGGPWSWWTWYHGTIAIRSSNPALDLSLSILLVSRTLHALDQTALHLTYQPMIEDTTRQHLISQFLAKPFIRLAKLCHQFLRHHPSLPSSWLIVFEDLTPHTNGSVEVGQGLMAISPAAGWSRNFGRDGDWGSTLDDVTILQIMISLTHKRIFVLTVLAWLHSTTPGDNAPDLPILEQSLGLMLEDGQNLSEVSNSEPRAQNLLVEQIVSKYNENFAKTGVQLDFKQVSDKFDEWRRKYRIKGQKMNVSYIEFARTAIKAICQEQERRQAPPSSEAPSNVASETVILGLHQETSSSAHAASPIAIHPLDRDEVASLPPGSPYTKTKDSPPGSYDALPDTRERTAHRLVEDKLHEDAECKESMQIMEREGP